MAGPIKSFPEIQASIDYETNWMRSKFTPEEKATFQQANHDLAALNTLFDVEAEKLRKSEPFVKNGFSDEKFKPFIKMLLVAKVFNPVGREPINIRGISEFLNMHSSNDNGLKAESKFAHKFADNQLDAVKNAGIPVELFKMQKIQDVAHALSVNFVNPPKTNIKLDNNSKSVHDLDGKAMIELAKLQTELNKAKPGSDIFKSLSAQTKSLMEVRSAAIQFNTDKMSFENFVDKVQNIQRELEKLPKPKTSGFFNKSSKEIESVKIIGEFVKENGQDAQAKIARR